MRPHPRRILSLLLLLTLCCVGLPSAAWANEDDHDISLVVGGQKVLPAAGVQSYSEGAPGIVQVKVPDDQRKIVITALKPGSTSLLLIYTNGKQETFTISVYSRSLEGLRKELKGLTQGLTGLDIRELGGKIFLDGAVPSQEDMSRIERLVQLYGGQVQSLVVVDPAKQRLNIKLDLHFVQFRKTSQYKLGMSWPGNVGAHPAGAGGGSTVNFLYTYDFIAKAATQGQLVVAENLLPSLDILGIKGWAKVKNTVSVITTNGGTAVYHTGGEVNIKIAAALGQSGISKVPFGVQLTVQPRLDPQSGLVVVTIDAEQSQLTPISGQEVPGRVLTQTKTNVHLKVGQSIMLSGFLQNNETFTATGIPGLMRIPILGYLFRTDASTGEDQENVLFITPTVIEHTTPDNTRRIEDAIKRYDDFGSRVVF